MGLEAEYKNGKLKVRTWGKTDSNEAQRIMESVGASICLKREGKYRSDSDYASKDQMEHDLRRKQGY